VQCCLSAVLLFFVVVVSHRPLPLSHIFYHSCSLFQCLRAELSFVAWSFFRGEDRSPLSTVLHHRCTSFSTVLLQCLMETSSTAAWDNEDYSPLLPISFSYFISLFRLSLFRLSICLDLSISSSSIPISLSFSFHLLLRSIFAFDFTLISFLFLFCHCVRFCQVTVPYNRSAFRFAIAFNFRAPLFVRSIGVRSIFVRLIGVRSIFVRSIGVRSTFALPVLSLIISFGLCFAS